MGRRHAQDRGSKPRAFLVLGVHRSGTSALARVLNLLGVSLGPDLMLPKPEINDRGFWESERIVELHDELLDLLRVRWDDTLALPEMWWLRPDVARLRDEILAVLRTNFDAEPWWGVKDPRLCRLLPLWRLILKDLRCDPHCVFIVRSPHEVADSLARRDGLDAAHSSQLWLDHSLAAESASRGLSRAFVTYPDLLTDWRSTTADLAGQLGVSWPVDANLVESEIEAFLSSDLRHFQSGDEEVARDPELSRWVVELYAALCTTAESGQDGELRATADRIRNELQAAERLYAPAMVRAQNTLRSKGQELIEAAEEIRTRDVEIKLQRRRIKELKQNAEEQVEKLDEAQVDARTARGWALTQQTEIERLRGIIELRNERIDGLQREVGRRGGEALSRWAELGQARQEVIQAREQLMVAQESVALAHQEAAKVRAQAEERLAQLESRVSELEERAVGAEERVNVEGERARRAEAEAARAEAEADRARADLAEIHDSITFRFTRRPRALWQLLRGQPDRASTGGASSADAATRAPAEIPVDALANPPPVVPADSKDSKTVEVPTEEGAEHGAPSEELPPSATQQPERPPAPPERIELPPASAPVVSIIIPVFEQLHYTLACVRAIATCSSSIPFEVIVIDDASRDATAQLEDRLGNARVVRFEENRGFVHSCNAGALEARGDYLVFLNNDTEVRGNWLEALQSVFESRPDAGAVGAKLLDPGGGLQEAGGIIWSDATGWNYGRGEDHGRPAYNYLREVDYCSGACLMIPRKLFMDVGMFDTRYAPAYYEDVDLCFAVRKAGKRVYYQPRAEVMHHEGVSNGTDLNQGIKQYQEINRAHFAEKWREELTHQQVPGSPLARARQRGVGRKVLVVDARTPILDNDAGSLRMFRVLEVLAQLGCDVSFSGEFPFFLEGSTERMQDSGVEAIYPSPELASLEQLLATTGEFYDTVILSRFYVARNWTTMVRKYCPNARIILDTVDLHFVRERREADVAGWDDREDALVHIRYEELAAAAAADLTLVVSDEEKALLAEEAPAAQVDVLPTIHRTRPDGPGHAERAGLLFIGNFQHPPNIDAIEYYVKEIHPLVQERLPGVVLTIIGANAPPQLLELASDVIVFQGKVGDIDPEFDRNRVSIAPLRYGAGVKGKIITSMSLGLPVVTTSVGAEGLKLERGQQILVEDDPAAFADAVARVYGDPELWAALAREGLDSVEAHFSFEVSAQVLRRVVRIDEQGKPLDNQPLSDAQRRLSREIEVYSDVEEVHDLPPIYHYWSNRYLLAMLNECGIRGINEFFLDNILAECRKRPDELVEIASIGAGNGDTEVWLALRLREAAGVENFRFQCLELNPHMVERGRALVLNEGVDDHVSFQELNIEEWRADRPYPVVIANHSLHHIVGLERIFDEVKKAIGEGGCFLVNDMIGRNGHMLWPEALEPVEQIWQRMPDRYKFNHSQRRFEEHFDNWDCSTEHNEGIRAQDILPLLMERFQFEVFCPFANIIDVFIGRSFGQNLDPEREDDRVFVDEIAALDHEKLDSGEIKPTHMLAVMRAGSVDGCRHYRHWTTDFCVRVP